MAKLFQLNSAGIKQQGMTLLLRYVTRYIGFYTMVNWNDTYEQISTLVTGLRNEERSRFELGHNFVKLCPSPTYMVGPLWMLWQWPKSEQTGTVITTPPCP